MNRSSKEEITAKSAVESLIAKLPPLNMFSNPICSGGQSKPVGRPKKTNPLKNND